MSDFAQVVLGIAFVAWVLLGVMDTRRTRRRRARGRR